MGKGQRMEQKIIRTHRVGTITLAVMLILFGTLFLLHAFFPALNYAEIFRLWPCIFIFLGLEILAGTYKAARLSEMEIIKFTYDKAAILLIIALSFFAMIMASIDYCLQYGGGYIQF